MGRAPECPWMVGPYALVSGPPMSRRSLRPQLNQIRGWVRQGRTDAWIAHQLEVTVQQIQAFKREQGLEPDVEENGAALEEVDLRAEDDAQIAAELEAEAAAQRRRRGRVPPKRPRARPPKRRPQPPLRLPPKRPRTTRSPSAPPRRRGGRSRRRSAPAGPLEGTFDHGEEGYGLWLDPAVQDDPDLRRALGGPPPRRDHDRGRPDRDPPRRRRRGRRRRLIRAALPRSLGGARRIRLQCDVVEPWEHGSVLRTPSAPGLLGRELRARRGRCVRSGTADARAGRRRAAGRTARHRKLEVEDEAPGARMRPFFEAAGWVADRNAVMLREGPAPAHRGRRGGRAARDARRCASSGTSATRTTRPRRRRVADAAGPHLGARAGCARSSCATQAASRSASRRSPWPSDGVEIDQLYVTPEARGTRPRRATRRGRARRRRARRGVGRRRRRGPRPGALRAARVRDRLALATRSSSSRLR